MLKMSREGAAIQMNEHAGQAQPTPRLPSMDPATSAARALREKCADRSVGRPWDSARQERADRPSTARTTRTLVRYGAGF
jgi:hypothetical protein